MSGNGHDPIVLVAGDVYADWLLFERQRQTQPAGISKKSQRAWKTEQQVFIPAVHGGAWIVQRFMRMLLAHSSCKYVHTYKRFEHHRLRSGDSRHVIHQFTSLRQYPISDGGSKSDHTYRATPSSYRFSGPENENDQIHPVLLPSYNPEVEDAKAVMTALFNKESTEEIEQIGRPGDRGLIDHIKATNQAIRFFPGDSRRVIVVYDRGNGFVHYQNYLSKVPQDDKEPTAIKRDSHEAWKYLFYKGNAVEVHEKISNGLPPDADLIDHILVSVKVVPRQHSMTRQTLPGHPILDFLSKHKLLDRTSVILDANDLRLQGAHITRGASWERTAEDTYRLLGNHPFLKALEKAHKIVIRFGISGAMVRLQHGGLNRTSIVFDPGCNEQGYGDTSLLGVMYPMDAVMTAVLAADFFRRQSSAKSRIEVTQPEDCLEAVTNALSCCRSYFDRGVNPQILTRDAIESWDSDYRLDEYDPLQKKREHRATVCSYYEKETWEENRVSVRFDIIVNDEYNFGKLFRDPRMALNLCHQVAEKTFGDELKEELVACLEAVGVESPDAFDFEIKEYEGRSSRVLATLKVELSEKGISALQKICDELVKRFRKPEGKKEAPFLPDLPKSMNLQERFVILLQQLIAQHHEVVAQDFHHRCYAPFTLLPSPGNVFCRFNLVSPFTDNWVMLPSGKSRLIELSKQLVMMGFENLRRKQGGDFAIAQFGEMTVVDRFEIETYRSLNSLIKNYLKRKFPDRPLCAAVFGPPGSGKSFGVKQLARGCDIRGEDILEYNLSQFESRSDLERALINVRNACSPNRTPLVFFDEFDSSHQGEQLGWLKMFLSVMQDGTFAFAGDIMRLGKSILIFAGGTSRSFSQFSRSGTKGEDDSWKYFESVKGPDFVSRLRGYIDIAGINPADVLQEENCFHYLRRAAIIRSIIQREYPDLLDNEGVARVDPGVLNALICVSRYTHGARSLAALFDMSNLVGRPTFERSHLPSAQQLAMHLEKSDSHDGVKELFSLLDS